MPGPYNIYWDSIDNIFLVNWFLVQAVKQKEVQFPIIH